MSFERKQYEGAARPATLVAAINDTATTFTINSYVGWPDGSDGPFVVCIDRSTSLEEKMLCSGLVPGSGGEATITVTTRGYDGTSAVNHGTTVGGVEHVIDAATIDQANRYVNLQANKGDLVAHDGTNAQAVAVGSDGDVVVADSSATSGIAYSSRLTDAEADIVTNTSAIATNTTAIATNATAITGKASTSHNHDSSYAGTSHNHDSSYAGASHNHDSSYAGATHNHDSSYASGTHNHDSAYAPATHGHTAATHNVTGLFSGRRSNGSYYVDANGYATITHSLGSVPVAAFVQTRAQITTGSSGGETVISLPVTSMTSTTLTFRAYEIDSGSGNTSGNVSTIYTGTPATIYINVSWVVFV